MKACEQRNLVCANEHDVIEAINEGELSFPEIINILGEEAHGQGSYFNDMANMYMAENLTQNGRDFIYALANWARWYMLKDRKDEETLNFKAHWPLSEEEEIESLFTCHNV